MRLRLAVGQFLHLCHQAIDLRSLCAVRPFVRMKQATKIDESISIEIRLSLALVDLGAQVGNRSKLEIHPFCVTAVRIQSHSEDLPFGSFMCESIFQALDLRVKGLDEQQPVQASSSGGMQRADDLLLG